MECPPSSPPRLLPGFAPNKNAKFQIYQDNAALPTPLPTSERDIVSSPTSETSDAVMPARRALEQLKTIKLRPDVPVLVGRSSRACDFVLKCSNKLVSRIHARVCYESATDLVTVECLGWNGLTVIVPGRKGPKEYPVVRNQTIYIEKVNGIEVSIQNIRTFVEVVSGPSETTEDEVDFRTIEYPNEVAAKESVAQPKADVIERTIAALRARTVSPPAVEENVNATATTDPSSKENVKPKRVHFESSPSPGVSKVELSKPKVTTLAEYRERRRSLVQETKPIMNNPVNEVAQDSPIEDSKVESNQKANETEQTPMLQKPFEESVPAAEADVASASAPVPAPVAERESAPDDDVEMDIETKAPEPIVSQESSISNPVAAISNGQEEAPAVEDTNIECVMEIDSEPPALATEDVSTPSPAPEVATEDTPEPISREPTASSPALEESNNVHATIANPNAPEEEKPSVIEAAPLTTVEDLQTKPEHTASTEVSVQPVKRAAPATPKAAKKPRTTRRGRPSAVSSQEVSLTGINTKLFERLAANCVAFSRLNSTPLSHILASSQELEDADPAVIAKILEDVACIGVIQREGKDALGKPLEPEYYYISELDANKERQQMVIQSKGRKSLRACRRVHKQYFYKRPK